MNNVRKSFIRLVDYDFPVRPVLLVLHILFSIKFGETKCKSNSRMQIFLFFSKIFLFFTFLLFFDHIVLYSQLLELVDEV